jgi:hypothetical protein
VAQAEDAAISLRRLMRRTGVGSGFHAAMVVMLV